MDVPLGPGLEPHMEDQAQEAPEVTPVCRLIGPGGPPASLLANGKAATVIREKGCQLIDWDGDPIGSEGGGRTFASAIRELGGVDIKLSPHCVPADCGSKLDGNSYGGTEEKAAAVRAAGNEYMAPGVQMVPQAELDRATEVIQEHLGRTALELRSDPEHPLKEKNSFDKYLALAVADRLKNPPDLVIWQMDNGRDEAKYWNWVSLAEYQAMRNVQTKTTYILINNEGHFVQPGGQPWEHFDKFPVSKPLVADEPLAPIMQHHGLGAGAMPEPPMEPY